MSTILDEIIRHKTTEIAAAKARLPFFELEKRISDAPPARGFVAALRKSRPPGLIAEVKKASPSAGIIRADFDPVSIALTYQSAGAACLSVLTDEQFFQGHLNFLHAIRQAVEIPVMRKEFIIDRYQIAEARTAGADCILLIAECLTASELQDLYDYSTSLGMDTLIEFYDDENLPKVLATGCPLVGINNRDLRSFHTSLERTFRIRPQIPPEIVFVSESGIRTYSDIERLRASNVGAVLVGESLMRQADIAAAVKSLMTGN